MDEYYSIRLSGEVFRGMKENALRGAFQARPPLGYKIVEHGKPPVIVPEEAAIIRLIFDKYVNGLMSFFDIARYLNSLGLKTSHNKDFERRSIEYIIQNPIYCGLIRWNRTENATNNIKDKDEWIIVDGEHEPIISKELFNMAQERFKATYKPFGARPSSTYRHWLSGLLKCPDCGRSLSATTKHQTNGVAYSYFSCYGYSKGKCNRPNGVSSLVLEKEFIRALEEVYTTGSIEYEVVEYEPVERVNECTIIQKRINELVPKEERIKASYREGIDTLEEYKENKRLLQQERERLELQLKELLQKETSDSKDNSTNIMLERVRAACEILKSNQYTTTQKSETLKQIISKVTYNRKKDLLTIHYILYK